MIFPEVQSSCISGKNGHILKRSKNLQLSVKWIYVWLRQLYKLWIIFRSVSVGFSPTWIFCKMFKVTWNQWSIPGHVGPCLTSQAVWPVWPMSNKAGSISNPQLLQQPKPPTNSKCCLGSTQFLRTIRKDYTKG